MKFSRAVNPLPGNEAPEFAIGTTLASSDVIDMSIYAVMRFWRVSGALATITWWEADRLDAPDAEWVPMRVDSVAVTSSTGAFSNNLPVNAGAAFFLKGIGNVEGVIKVCRKG